MRRGTPEAPRTFAQDLGNLKQHFMQLSDAHASNEKKIGDMGSEMAQAKREVAGLRKQLLDGRMKLQFPFTSDRSGRCPFLRSKTFACEKLRDFPRQPNLLKSPFARFSDLPTCDLDIMEAVR
jgi:uncharacterized protein YdcH (DUF465 family)